MYIKDPNWEKWAQNIAYNIHMKNLLITDMVNPIREALEQAYNQGYQLGLNKGWAIERSVETATTYQVDIQKAG